MAANYISIESILDKMQLQTSFGDIIDKKERFQLKQLAIQCVEELNLSIFYNHMSIDREVGDDGSIELPDNYLDYIALYVLEKNNTLVPLAKNKAINVSVDPILDDAGDPITDNNGEPIYSSGSRTPSTGTLVLTDEDNRYKNRNRVYSKTRYGSGGGQNAYGYYKIDIYNNRIHLDLRSGIETVVLDYVADTIDDKYDIVVPRALQETVIAWINWKVVEYNLNIPMGVKEKMERLYKREKKLAKRKMNRFRIEEYLYTSSKNNMQAIKF